MGLPPKKAEQGGERCSWPDPRPDPQAAAAVPATIPTSSRSAYGSKASEAAPASDTPTTGASWYKTASKAVVSGTEPAAPEASTSKADYYVYIRVLWEKVAPVNTGRTETVQHHVSKSAEPRNSAPVFQSLLVQLPAPVSQQWLGDSSNVSYARVPVLQPGGSSGIRAWIRSTPDRISRR